MRLNKSSSASTQIPPITQSGGFESGRDRRWNTPRSSLSPLFLFFGYWSLANPTFKVSSTPGEWPHALAFSGIIRTLAFRSVGFVARAGQQSVTPGSSSLWAAAIGLGRARKQAEVAAGSQ